PPGTSVTDLDVFSDTSVPLAATSQPVSPASGAYFGTLTSAVYGTAAGTLDFYYQFSNAAGSSDDVVRLTAFNFAGFTTNVGYRTPLPRGGVFTPAGTEAPVAADRSADGSTVGFGFDGPPGARIGPGETSRIVVIRTNATSFQT